jgi:hypothetical protein
MLTGLQLPEDILCMLGLDANHLLQMFWDIGFASPNGR